MTTTFEGPSLRSCEGIGALTLGGFIEEVASRFPDNEAVVFDDPLAGGATQRFTYRRLAEQTRRIATALVVAGVRPGDFVGIVMGNRPEALAAIFAAASTGAVAAPMSTFATRPELEVMVDLCRPQVVLTQSTLAGRRFGEDLRAIASTRPWPIRVAVLGESSWEDLLAAAAGETTPRQHSLPTPEDPALVVFSSGTTGEPKGILHTNRSPSLQSWLQARIFGRDAASRVFSALPLFWTAGFNTAVGATLAAGGCWVAQEIFEPGAALGLMARERVTEPYTLPHQTAALAEHPAWEATDLSSLRCVYGKGAYARHPRVDGDPGWIMPVGYGLSETCAFVCAHPSDTPRERAAHGHGQLLAGVSLRVVDPDTGEPLAPGETGELAVGGTTLMAGYLGRDRSDTFDADGFFHTGDVGHIDPDGNVHYHGRRTEMIRTGGANVSPAEVEVALRACPQVKLSRVVGMPDDRLGEVVVAAVVARDGEEVTAERLREFLRGRIAGYKVPRHVLFVDEADMPMTQGDSKVRDTALAELVGARLRAATGTSTGISTATHQGAT